MSGKPRRPMSAFFLWFSSHRAAIKAQHPELSVVQIAKKAGEMWRSMVDKTSWEIKARRLMDKYLEDLTLYYARRQRWRDGPRRKRRRFGRARSFSSDEYSD